MSEPLPLIPLDSSTNEAQKPSAPVVQSIEIQKSTPEKIGIFATPAKSNFVQPVDQAAGLSPINKDEKEGLKSKFSGFFKGLVQKKESNFASVPSMNIPQVLTPEPLSSSSALAQHTPSPIPLGTMQATTIPHSTQVTPVPLKPFEKNNLKDEGEKTGNLFTRLFKGSIVNEEKRSIIDTIVSKEEEQKKREKQLKMAAKEAKKALKNPSDGMSWFRASRLFLHFTLLFIALGTTFLYIQIVDVNNSVFSWFNGPQNYASRLSELELQLQELGNQEAQLKGDVTRFQEGYSDPNEAVVAQIVQKRSSWPEVEEQLYGAAKQLYPLNDFFNYVEYTNFNLNFEAQQVSFTASLKDPSGNNFSALADFEKILKSYPGDPDQEDGVKPYFTDLQDINNYSERYDANTDTYETVFSMTAKINTDSL